MSSSPTREYDTRPTSLIPLRIDVCSGDGQIRIIDTILFDPSCWPIPLLPPLHESVEKNVTELAHSIISDSEVIGMGRTVRHFTNRVDVWSQQLQELVEHQLRVQLWKIVRGNLGGHFHENDVALHCGSRGTTSATSTTTHISLRLTVNNISISDDFDWDMSVPNMCPIGIAENLAIDLNLPSEAVVAIATSIVEQLHHVPMSSDETLTDASSSRNETGSMDATTATMVESRDHVANLAHAVASHRPANLDRRIT